MVRGLTRGTITYCVQDTGDPTLFLEKVRVYGEQTCARAVGEKGSTLRSERPVGGGRLTSLLVNRSFRAEEVGEQHSRQWEPHLQRHGFIRGWSA